MFLWPLLDVSSNGQGVGLQVNKFEQVSSNGQMSLAAGRVCPEGYPNGPCNVTYPHPHEQTNACENITFPLQASTSLNMSRIPCTVKSYVGAGGGGFLLNKVVCLGGGGQR